MNRRHLVVATTLLGLVVFAGGAAFVTKNQPAAVPIAKEDSVLVRPHSPVIGPETASVTIVEFFDPSCEACRAFYPIVKQIMARTDNEVRLFLCYTPLHQGSDEAVRILEAARKQDKFEPVLEALLAAQPEWAVHGAPDLDKAWQFAATGGLDVALAMKDAITPEVDAVLAQDIADMRANNIQQTPTFFVNGKPLTEFSPQGLLNLVRSELEAAKPSS